MKPTPSARANVLVLGTEPIDEAEFSVRGLKLMPVGLGDFNSALLSDARGVLISERPGPGSLAAAFFRRHFRDACAAGVTTLVNATGPAVGTANRVRDLALENFGLTDPERAELKMLVEGTSATLAHTLYEHKPGPQIGHPRVELYPRKKTLAEETKLLLQRAFWDCEALTLEVLQGGKTAMQTFRASVTLKWTGIAPEPMPFFVKIGDRRSIAAERRHYKEWAEPFIPFHLRPNLCESRVVCTPGTSALVCNFVDGATPLRPALRTDQGAGTLFSLFEVTLRGLRIQAMRTSPTKGAVQTFLSERVRAAEITARYFDRIAAARELRPSTRAPELVEAALKGIAADMWSRRGIYHGDLHSGNVMVRRHDAIVIDFGSMEDVGPLSADPAFLEVSLAFGTDNMDSPDSFEEWRRFIDETFLENSPSEPPLLSLDQFNFVWLRKALREIRHVVKSCGVSDQEMTVVLCGCLLRFGRLDAFDLSDQKLVALSEKRRAYALVVADRLCDRLERHHATS